MVGLLNLCGVQAVAEESSAAVLHPAVKRFHICQFNFITRFFIADNIVLHLGTKIKKNRQDLGIFPDVLGVAKRVPSLVLLPVLSAPVLLGGVPL